MHNHSYEKTAAAFAQLTRARHIRSLHLREISRARARRDVIPPDLRRAWPSGLLLFGLFVMICIVFSPWFMHQIGVR